MINIWHQIISNLTRWSFQQKPKHWCFAPSYFYLRQDFLGTENIPELLTLTKCLTLTLIQPQFEKLKPNLNPQIHFLSN